MSPLQFLPLISWPPKNPLSPPVVIISSPCSTLQLCDVDTVLFSSLSLVGGLLLQGQITQKGHYIWVLEREASGPCASLLLRKQRQTEQR